jgi:hypothetical protein
MEEMPRTRFERPEPAMFVEFQSGAHCAEPEA